MGDGNIKMRYCTEIYPAEVSKVLYERETNIAIIGLVSASLSLIGSASILGFIIWKKLIKVKRIQPLFHLSLADFILSLLWIIMNAKYFLNTLDRPAYTAISCFVWQLLTEITHLVTIFLTINYAVDVYLRMRDRTIQVHMVTEGNEVPDSTVQKRFKISLYIISWSFPILIMMPIIANVKADNICACQKCVILIDVAVLRDANVPREYGYIVLAVTLIFAAIIILIVYCLSLKLYWKSVPGFHTDHQRRQLYNMQVRVTVYMLVFAICWAPGLWISFHKWLYHPNDVGFSDVTKYYPTYVLQAFFAPLQGFFNSIVYGWTKKTFRSSNLPPPLNPRGENLITPYYDYASYASDDENVNNRLSERLTDPPLGY